ncbi:sensor histidine kinase [Actinophytocola algeriensis]|uniref:histidine kinase n=1 Tax=Actinophytocola algeriensis TaxID=1768010 RepID=A0A7W7Q7Y9_9PSEU|nr:ATP-binding protein [Actinophytocola algeriensis]MBB4908751.1 two-component system sensor histidine kinase BaeS [Actinophytocola algeriensis]MBE1474862.1 two-component system sensor histidine kinase BaeS [Actinophytocola algeriensis]
MTRRHSLLTRLLAMSVVVAGCSVGASAWLAAQSTSGAINQEIGESLATDAEIYDLLLGHAATHRNWSGVRVLVDRVARETGRHITVTTPSRAPIADSGGAPESPLPRTPSAVVDPLSVDPVLKPDAGKSGIDARAVGPYRLTTAERDGLRRAAQAQLTCLRGLGRDGVIVEKPNGRSAVDEVTGAARDTTTLDPGAPVDQAPPVALRPSDDQSSPVAGPVRVEVPPTSEHADFCPRPAATTTTETAASTELLTLVNACLDRQGKAPLPTLPAELVSPDELRPAPDDQRCVDSARREQLASHVSAPAYLYIGKPGARADRFDLSTVGYSRIAWTALAVLVLTVGVTALAATRLVRPIHAITSAARKMGDGERSARVETTARGEIGELATAFNRMSEQIETAERQRRTMVSDVAHELRTPLVNIRGWLEAAQDGMANLEPALVASLVEETVLLQHIIDDLQDLALADAGKLRMHQEQVSVRSILAQVASAHQGHANAAGVALRVTIDGEPDLSADPTRLRQALGNLVSNALRHTQAGGRVTLSAGRGPGDEVLIDVADTGSGIDAESLPHIFDRFWRADRSRSRASGGSGLGLAITHHLIAAHGGRIEVRSTPGTGTTFTIHLPANPA